MNLPKQSAPVQRTTSAVRSIVNSGVNPSITRQDIRDFMEGIQIGQDIVTQLLRPIPNILQTLGPFAALL